MTNAGDRGPLWISAMEQVDWAKLDYAYGDATNVSELIRTIAFGDEAEACEACTTLHGELVHQSSVYSSTYEAIPFLIETLAVTGSGSGVRRGVLTLLDDIVASCVYWIEMEGNTDPALAEGQDGWVPPSRFIERAWLGLERFARLLHDDDDADVRTRAAHLLGMLLTPAPRLAPADPPGRYASAVATLVARLHGNEVDELVLSSVVFALGRASARDPSPIQLMRDVGAKPNVGESTRVAAALAVMEIDRGKLANLQEVDLLIDTMCRAAETDTLYQVRGGTGSERRSPWIGGRLRFRLRAALCDWSAGDQAHMERVLPALLAGVRLTSGYVASADLGPVFAWLWPDRCSKFSQGANGTLEYVRPPPITPKDLAGVARQVVQACYDNPSIWEPPVGNTSLAFRDVGLPETRVGLKDLLGRF
jgi:hypothetical protein